MTNKEAVKIFEERLAFGEKEYSDVAKDYIEAIKTAISALRAQEKEPCEYCLQGEDLAYGLDSMQRTGRIYIDGNLLTADLYSESMAVAVCYCPMCGRPLK